MEMKLAELVLYLTAFIVVLCICGGILIRKIFYWRRQARHWREQCEYNTGRLTTAIHGFLATRPAYPAFNQISIKTIIETNEQSGRPHSDIANDYAGLLKCTDSPVWKKKLRDLIRKHGGTVTDPEDVLERLIT